MVSLKRDAALLAGLVWRAAPGAAAVVAACALLAGTVPAAELSVTRRLVNLLAPGPAHPGALAVWLAGLVAIRAAGAGLGAAGRLAGDDLSGRATFAATEALYAKALTLPPSAFDGPGAHDRLAQATDSGGESPGLFRDALGLLAGLPALATYLAVTLYGGWMLPVLALASLLPGFWISVNAFEASYHLYGEQTPVQRRLHYLEELLTARADAKEVRLLGAAAPLLARWRALHRQLAAEVLAVALRTRWLALVPVAARTAGFAAALWWLILRAHHGALDAGTFVIATESVRGLQGACDDALRRAAQLRDRFARAASGLCRFLLEEPAGPPWPSGNGPAPSIQARDVGFRYPAAPAPALAGVDLDIAAGEVVALVGENGAGKSTLVRLLLGLDRPATGEMRWSGPARRAAVFQDFVRYPLTARENVALGRVEASDDGPAIAGAARQVGVLGVIESLPDRWETVLGPEHGGMDLSGGQWQALAVARALLAHAPLIAFDEPTSALDPLAEAAAFRRFATLAAGATAVVCTHRLGSARLADRIVVLRGGRICESGTHVQLLERDGEYARLWAAQSQWYR